MHYAIEAEKIHAELYRKAKQEVSQGKDLEISEVYICPVCGYTHEGKPPEKCPVCGASRDMFKKF
jgi:rubrerythrin